MLSEKNQLLLSAYVDGGLSNQERDAANKLLRDSAEARTLVGKLTENVQKVKRLPRKKLDAEFPARIVASLPRTVPTVQSEATTPAPFEQLGDIVQKPRLRRGMPAWMVGGIAASLVGVAVLGGMLLLREKLDDNRNLLPKNHAAVSVKPGTIAETPSPVDDLIAQIVAGSSKRYGEVQPDPIVASKQQQQPIRYAFGDLQKQDSYDSLKWELAHTPSSGVHLDVTLKYNARSLNRIIDSFHKQGVQLVVTPPAEASLAKKQPLLVYCENVPSDKLAFVLRELSEIDITGNKKEASTFVAVKVSPDSADDHTRFSQSLGIDPRQLKSPAAPVPQVSSLGVVLPAERPANPASVREIRGFLAGRGPVRIGTLQVFIHLQPTEK